MLASAEKAVRTSGGPNRRRSVRGGAGAVERIDSVDKFLEEVRVRIYIHAYMRIPYIRTCMHALYAWVHTHICLNTYRM